MITHEKNTRPLRRNGFGAHIFFHHWFDLDKICRNRLCEMTTTSNFCVLDCFLSWLVNWNSKIWWLFTIIWNIITYLHAWICLCEDDSRHNQFLVLTFVNLWTFGVTKPWSKLEFISVAWRNTTVTPDSGSAEWWLSPIWKRKLW